MGPETGGLIALGMIGMAAGFIAWASNGTCKMGRHEWGPWTASKQSSNYSYHHSAYLHFQDRVCKKCNKEKRRYFKK
jgi:hypothetical protein